MTHDRAAFATTFLLWIVFFTFALFLPLPMSEDEKSVYGEISIQLEPLNRSDQYSIAQNTVQDSLPIESPSVMEQVAKSETTFQEVQNEVQETQGRNNQQSSSFIEEPVRQQVLAKSIEELMAEQNTRSQRPNQAEWTDDLFEDSAVNTSSQTQSSSNIEEQRSSLLSGSSAQSNDMENPTSQAVSGREQIQRGLTSADVSSETSNLLSSIANAQSSAAGSQSGQINAQSMNSPRSNSSNASGYDFAFDGVARKLLYPSDPTLEISRENQHLIQASRNIEISLIVSPSGNVSPSSINFTPSALVPTQIQLELRQQIASWRFESGVSSGQATFIYSIIVE